MIHRDAPYAAKSEVLAPLETSLRSGKDAFRPIVVIPVPVLNPTFIAKDRTRPKLRIFSSPPGKGWVGCDERVTSWIQYVLFNPHRSKILLDMTTIRAPCVLKFQNTVPAVPAGGLTKIHWMCANRERL